MKSQHKRAVRLRAAAAVALLCTMSACAEGEPDVAGTWGQDLPGEPHLVLHDDYTVAGSDGCNRLMGSWELTDETVEFGQLASTRMMCEGVDTWLSLASSATLESDELLVLDAEGEHIGTLARAE